MRVAKGDLLKARSFQLNWGPAQEEGSGEEPLPCAKPGSLRATYVPAVAAATWSRMAAALAASARPKITRGAFVPASSPQ